MTAASRTDAPAPSTLAATPMPATERRGAGASEGTATLDKALDVLDAVGSVPQGISQAELSVRLNVPRTTLYRLLAALVARGLIRRDPQRRVYRLGFRCFEMARQAHDSPDLVAAASPELRALRDLTGETTYLAVLDGVEVLSLERFDGAHSQRSRAAVGQRKPLHCTSQGKAILSVLSAERRDALVKDMQLKAMTPRTLTDRRRLLAELKITAARGWSVDDEEVVSGIRCVGAPVVDPQGQVRGALSVAGPAWRMTRARLEALGPEVADAARRVGAQLGGSAAHVTDSEARVIGDDWAFQGCWPHWDAPRQRLLWADALAPALRVWDGQHDRAWLALDEPLLAVVPTPSKLWLAQAQGWRWAGDDGVVQALQPWSHNPPSAACSDADGQLWLCVPHANGGWELGRWSAAQGLETMWLHDEEVHALAWDAHGGQLVGACSRTGSIWLFRPGQRAVRRLVTVPKGSGRLSGLAVDAAGGAWCALLDGWSVVRFAPDGHLDRVVGLPVPHPTDVCLGGPNQSQLYVTSARQSVPIEGLTHAPLSGRLFCVEVGS